MSKYKGKETGRCFSRSTWYSICSRHFEPDTNCVMCMTGQYVSNIRQKAGNIVFRVSPRLWRWFANRSIKSQKRKLSQKDTEAFVNMLNNAAEPNKTLKEAAERYKQSLRSKEK